MSLTLEQQRIINAIKSRVGDTALTDEELYALFVEKNSVNAVAAEVWSQKAGEAGDFIDITEGSSTRKLSQIATQAREMAAFYSSLYASEGGSATPGRPSRVRAIERP